MAKGFDQNQERLEALSLLGKPLARRSQRRCELCEQAGVELSIYEVPPVPKNAEPELERCLFLCRDCRLEIEKPAKMQPGRWACLRSTAWSEEPVVQVMAFRLLRRLAPKQAWARELLEELYLDPEVEAWADLEV